MDNNSKNTENAFNSRRDRAGKVQKAVPSPDALREELDRERIKKRKRHVFFTTIAALAMVAALVIVAAFLWLPVFQIHGDSMTATLADADLVVAMKRVNYEKGDLIAFYYNNKILIKRVIAVEGEWVTIDDDGTVYVNNQEVIEPYAEEKALGDCNLIFPYQVPDGKVFVLGDNRLTSIDSRNAALGCVAEGQIVGKVILRVWPLKRIGLIGE